MVIFGVFTIYAILSYSTNYLTEMYGMSLVAASYMGDCDQQNLPRTVRPTWWHYHHLQQSEIPYPRDPNPFRTRLAGVNCPARHEL